MKKKSRNFWSPLRLIFSFLPSHINILIFGIIVLQFFLIVYAYRGALFETYDVGYWIDRYEHSQYQLPLSKRIIGDDGLYAYAGFRLAVGDDPFSINVDKPPVGKYLIGLSIYLFKNPVAINILYLLGILTMTYVLSMLLFSQITLSLTVVAFLITDPFLFTQIRGSWLDFPQLFFFMLHVLLFAFAVKKKSHPIIFFALAGFTLGLFAEIKPPIVLPIILGLEFLYVLKTRSYRTLYILFLSMIVGIVLPYTWYMVLGHTPIDLIRIHRFMYAFYRQSQLKPHWEAIWTTVLIGKFPDVVSRIWTNVSEWWIGTTLVWIYSLFVSCWILFRKQSAWSLKFYSIFFLSCLILFMFIPSYPRYVILLLPALYIFVSHCALVTMQKYAIGIILVYLAGAVFNTYTFLQPSPIGLMDNLSYNLKYLYFHDIYQEDLVMKLPTMSREEFAQMVAGFMRNGSITEIRLKPLTKLYQTKPQSQTIPVVMEYVTRNLGSFSEEKNITLVLYRGQWKILWDWNFVLNGYKPGYTLEETLVDGKRGSIVRNKDQKVLAEDTLGYLISVDPTKMDTTRETELLTLLSLATGLSPLEIQNGYLENPVRGFNPVGTFYKEISQKLIASLQSYPGVVLVPQRNRIYKEFDDMPLKNTVFHECCTRIYSPYSYHASEGQEKTWDAILHGADGGTLVLKNEKGVPLKTIIRKSPIFGNDVLD